jgi:hypothetical protein
VNPNRRTRCLAAFIAALSVLAGAAAPAGAARGERSTSGDYKLQWLVGPDDSGSTEVCEVRPDCNVILELQKGERYLSATVTEASGNPTPFEILDATGEVILGTYCGEVENLRVKGSSVRLHFINPNSCGQSTAGSYSVTFSNKPIK